MTTFLCILLAAISAATQDVESLTLAEAVAAALQGRPALRAVQLNMDLANSRVGQARAARLPDLRLSETITRGNNPVFVFGSLLEQARFGPQNFSLEALNRPDPITNWRTSLSSSVSVFDGFKTSARIAQAMMARDQADLERVRMEQRVRFEVVRDYSGLMIADEARRVAAKAVSMAQSDMERTRARLDAGLAVQSDLLAVQVQVAEFRQQEIQAEGNVITAAAVLNISMRVPLGRRYRLAEELVTKAFVLPAQEELLERALAQHPDYLRAQSAVEAAERGIDERRGEFLPELNAFGSAGASGPNLTSGSMDYSVGASLSINLFDRGRAARLEEARIQKQALEAGRDRVADQVRIEVVRAYQAYRSAKEQLAVAEATLAHADEALRIIQDRYEEGLTTITDVLRAETAVVRARLNAVASRQGHYVGYANVLLAAGELNDVRAFAP